MARRRKKINKGMGQRFTKTLITVASSVGVKKGLDFADRFDFMQSQLAQYGVSGAVTAGGVALGTIMDDQFVAPIGVGAACGAANKATDQVLNQLGLQGVAGVAEDFLELFEENEGMSGVQNEVQLAGPQNQIMIA